MTTQIWIFATVLWALVLACTISSILSQPFSKRQRIVWITIIVALPILGLLAFLPFSIRRDELPTAFLLRGTGKDKKKQPQRPQLPPASPSN